MTWVQSNGLQTYAGVVIDNVGSTSGIGSRFFTVSNGSLVLDPNAGAAVSPSNVIAARPALEMPRSAALRMDSALTLAAEIDAAPADLSAVEGPRGYHLGQAVVPHAPTGGRAAHPNGEIGGYGP